MKVIHILNELKFSGAEIMYVDAAPIFQQLGCELSVVNTMPILGEYAPHFENAGYQVYHKPFPNRKKFLSQLEYCKSFIQFLKEGDYDIIHIHCHRLMLTMSICAWLSKINSIYTFHNVFSGTHFYSYIFHYLRRWFAKHIFRCQFQTISDSVYENEKNYFHNETVKICNWYGGNRFYPEKSNEKYNIRREFGISNDALVLISVGGCSPIKRHADIIKALPRIVKEYPNTIYLHLGEGVSLENEKNLAIELDVLGYIFFCGNQTNVRKYLIASDIYLMPSKQEGISITTIEAMASEIPSILYNVFGLRDFNVNKECALLIPEDFSRLAESVISLFQDKEKQKGLITNAKQFVDSHFDMKTNATKIFKLYQKR